MSKILFLISIVSWVAFGDLKGQQVKAIDIQLPQVLFTDPELFEEQREDESLLARISDLIYATPAGEEITICVFKFGVEEIARQLIDAQQRGVKVRLILNKGDTSKDTNKEVKDLLKDELHDFHYIENDISDHGILHNKFILFSGIETTEGIVNNIVLQTSSNFQEKGARKLQDMLIISNWQLYFCFLDFWHEIRVLGQIDQLDHYEYSSCTDKEGNQAFYFPKRRDKREFGQDEILKVLKNIEEPKQAQIRFAHGKWDENREEIVEELYQLQEQGALVEVVTNSDVDKQIRKELRELDRHIYYLNDDFNMHTKFFLLQYQQQKQVWTGSHNLTERSLRENFEVLLKVTDHDLYDQYLQYFNEIKALAESE